MARFPGRGTQGSRTRISNTPPLQEVSKPHPPSADPDLVWGRVLTLLEAEEVAPTAAATATATTEQPKARRRGATRRRQRRRRTLRALDVIGFLVWLGLIVKVFIADWDRMVVSFLFPHLTWVLDLRWFFPLALLAMLLVLFKASRLGLGIAYVIAFPLVVVFWKIPKFLMEHRSPYVFFGLLSVVTTIASRSRRLIVSFTIACFSALLITLGDTNWLRLAGIVGMFATLGWVLCATSVDMLRSPAFIRAQEKLVRAMLSWDFFDRLIVPIQPNQLTLKSWKVDDAKAYRDSAGNAVLLRSSLAFSAYSLDRYRTGPTTVVLNAIAVISLILQIIAIFAFINYGVYLVDGSAFAYTREPNGLTFGYYSSAALYFSEVAALAPVTGLAMAVKIANGLVGGVILSTVILTIFFTYKGSRSDAISDEVVRMIKGKVSDVEKMSASQYQLPISDLELRLHQTNWGAGGVSRWLGQRIPADWKEESGPPSASTS
jgi:hypothetical protein